MANPINDILDEVSEELFRATNKFPTWPTDPLHAVAVVGEEFGEMTKAVLQQVYEPEKNQWDDVRKEAIQSMAMHLRFLLSLEDYLWEPVHPNEIGKSAPDPQYPSHRQYRRKLSAVTWDYDEETQWRGASQLHDQGNRFWYVIEIMPNGMFDVSGSDRELISAEDTQAFERFADAVAFCQLRESGAVKCNA